MTSQETPWLVKTASQPLAGQLAARLSERIHNGLLAPGARLPSVRQCAQQQSVSPSTVVAAYDQLLAQGLVEARRNRGFFIRNRALARINQAHVAIKTGAISGPGGDGDPGLAPPPVPANATALIRGMFHGGGDRLQPGLGAFPPDWLETGFLSAAVRRFTSGAQLQAFSLQYGEAAGDPGLRQALAGRLQALAIPAGASQIMTTVGATHALDIVSRTLLRAGDCVMVEEPGWAIEFARLDALGMRILPVPRGPDGPDLAVMARYCELHAPKLFVSVSVLHNPTGYCLSPGSAHRVLQLAQQYDFHIVEDDTYSHLAPDHATRLSALDGLQRTIYVSGFSKILAPGWRVGFMAAPAKLFERLLDTKLLATLTTPALLEKALAWCIDQGQLRRHAERIRIRLDLARARSVKLALATGCTFAAPPTGLFGWVETGVDTDTLAQRMLDVGYLLAPGSLFHAARAPATLMRINFCTTQDAAFWQVFGEVRA
ncbi:PLP-dependent aminotransferase family protein, partial [Rhodoferax sp.]|uniref:aminotransferase-like domain-containing protein n=1 Tax=Rhodoferax sp. TaxID=50421 RepID=UPI0026120A64